jgi:hypothetical protein
VIVLSSPGFIPFKPDDYISILSVAGSLNDSG